MDRARAARIGTERDPLASPPGPVVLAVTVAAVAALTVLLADWWPGTRNLTDADRFFFGAPILLVLLVTGLVWAIKTLYVVGRDRRWSRWILAAPAAVLAGGLLLSVLPVADFESARADLDAYVAAMPDDPEHRAEDVRIGGLELSRVFVGRDGAVFFVDDDATFLTVTSGWAYAPDGAPAGDVDLTATDLGGGWYSYTEVWRD
ncbi:DUF1109 domain-containing protein [Rhodococcus sp. NPDC058532]|uniref:DUF1109 domain-containing protein n=2 Tax=unclassified Rhodococcus (in: high G+C Gram-positive bacteria) TaxID=192944 RepID=UPI0036511A6D